MTDFQAWKSHGKWKYTIYKNEILAQHKYDMPGAHSDAHATGAFRVQV